MSRDNSAYLYAPPLALPPPEIEQHKLQYLRYYFGIEFAEKPQTHDALGDVLVIKKYFISSTNS